MAGFSTKGPGTGAPRVGSPSAPGSGVRFQKSVRPPTNFPRLTVSRRNYAKPEMGAEQPLGVSEGQKSNLEAPGSPVKANMHDKNGTPLKRAMLSLCPRSSKTSVKPTTTATLASKRFSAVDLTAKEYVGAINTGVIVKYVKDD